MEKHSLRRVIWAAAMLAAGSAFGIDGSGHSGGGGAIYCGGNRSWDPYTGQQSVTSVQNPRVTTVDFFEASLPTIGGDRIHLAAFGSMTEEEVIARLLKSLRHFPAYQRLIQQQIEDFGSIDSWTAADLTQYDDAKLAYNIPAGCSYVQLAIRQDEQLFANPAFIRHLRNDQRGFLRFHEAVYEKGAVTDSSSVRKLLHALIKLDALPDSGRAAAPLGIAELGKRIRYVTGVRYLSAAERARIGEWIDFVSTPEKSTQSRVDLARTDLAPLFEPTSGPFSAEDRALIQKAADALLMATSHIPRGSLRAPTPEEIRATL